MKKTAFSALCVLLSLTFLLTVCSVGVMSSAADTTEFQPQGQYSDYIRYRDTLSNTYNKLTSGSKSLNVVYFGGSVTVGFGASDQETKSWRALIGQWLVDTFPQANVTNINRAAGESGTYLGSFRFERDVIGANPDLVFIEYSINDLYSEATYEQAASQFETIVRGIRKKLPKCDIVTVLVTDAGRANGKLHTQAQAHEDISEAYGISSVHVGRALADYCPSHGGWYSFMRNGDDIVHPNDSGYAFYYGVVKEFMSNCLLHCEHGSGLKNHTVPSLQSASLHDGNTTVILPSQQLIDRSEELGGNGFSYVNGWYGVNNYDSYLYSDGTNDVLAVEFDGTELVMLEYPEKLSDFYVKIDDGDYQLKPFKGVHDLALNPVIIVTGLPSGKHTAYLKPNNPSGTGNISIGALYSRDETKQTTQKIQNLVTNGGFESGDYTGWLCKLSGSDLSSVWAPATDPYKYEGIYTMGGGGPKPANNSGLYQFLTVVPGKTYTLTAYAKAYGAANIGFTVIEGGSTSVNDRDRMGNLLQFVWGKHFEPGSNYAGWYDENDGQPNGLNELGGFYQNYEPDWQKITFDFTPTQGEVLLGFYGYGGWVFYDEISVVEAGVVNGGFEKGNLSGWQCKREITEAWAITDAKQKSGNYSAKGIGVDMGFNAGLYQAVSVEPNKTYTVTAYVNASSGAEAGIAVLEGVGESVHNLDRLGNLLSYMWGKHFDDPKYSATYDDDLLGKPNGINDLGGFYNKGALDWKRVSFDITPTQNIIILGVATFIDSAWFDDITITEKVEFEFTGVVNGNFEDGTADGWSCIRNDAWTVTDTHCKGGNYSAKGTGVGMGYNAGLYQFLSVEPNKTYTVTAYVDAPSGAEAGIAVFEGVGESVNNFDRLGNLLSYMWGKHFDDPKYSATYDNDLLGKPDGINDLGGFYNKDALDDWKRVSFDITPTQNTIVLGIGAFGDAAWFDDITITEKDGSLPMADNAALKCEEAGILKELKDGAQGLRFTHELTTAVGEDAETVTVNGVKCIVKSVGVLVVAGEYKDESDRILDLNAAGSNSKIQNETLTTCRKITDNGDGTRTYTFSVIINNISNANKAKDISCRSYIVCEDVAGNTIELYGNVVTTNVLEMYNSKDKTEFADDMEVWMGV